MVSQVTVNMCCCSSSLSREKQDLQCGGDHQQVSLTFGNAHLAGYCNVWWCFSLDVFESAVIAAG